MVDVKTAEIFNFSTIKEKTSYRGLSYKKGHKRQTDRMGTNQRKIAKKLKFK